jgi:hypothetical protein
VQKRSPHAFLILFVVRFVRSPLLRSRSSTTNLPGIAAIITFHNKSLKQGVSVIAVRTNIAVCAWNEVARTISLFNHASHRRFSFHLHLQIFKFYCSSHESTNGTRTCGNGGDRHQNHNADSLWQERRRYV